MKVTLATILVSTVTVLAACNCSAAEPSVKWRAEPNLDLAKSAASCGNQYEEPIAIEFDGKLLKTTAWSRKTYDMELLEPLNADGSGEVNALSMPLNRSMVVRFDAGHGPRNVTYWGRYYSGIGNAARCVYTFVPLKDKG